MVFSKVMWALTKPPFFLRFLSGVAQSGFMVWQRKDLELFPRDHPCSLNTTFFRQEWEHTTHSMDSVWAREKGENKRKTAGTEEGLDWMDLTVSYRKIFIYWVWGVESLNSEFDSHYYFLAWVTWVLLGAGVICHDISEGDEDKNSAHLRKNSFFWPPAPPPTVHTFFSHFLKQMCQRISKHIYQNSKIINYNKVSD